MSLSKIALFGANGQIGSAILSALLQNPKRTFTTHAFIPPNASPPSVPSSDNLTFHTVDLFSDTIAKDLTALFQTHKIDTVISALNGPVLSSQYTILESAASAGVKRFYPSEYGFHQIYRKPNDPQGYIHPLWDEKARFVEHLVLHEAIEEGKMSYTIIGCGDFYNQDREPVWCPWTQYPEQVGDEGYVLHVIGSPDAKADFSHIDDFAQFLVATLTNEERSENKTLNFKSDTISQREIAQLMEKYTSRKVRLEIMEQDIMHKVLADKENAPDDVKERSVFPVDFWFLVKGMQGAGKFRRPRGEVHNDIFPDVDRDLMTFDRYLKQRYANGVER